MLKRSSNQYLIVTGDFVKTGGMDRANFALADYLARNGKETHLVAHRVDDALLGYPNIIFHKVPKVAGSYFLSSQMLDRTGKAVAKDVSAKKGRIIVNGGVCAWGDTNWVHYVHSAYSFRINSMSLSALKYRIVHKHYLDAERKVLPLARLIIANSDKTKREICEHLMIAPEKIETVYLGADLSTFCPSSLEERVDIRIKLGLDPRKPLAVFVGGLEDVHKGFELLFSAWKELCADPKWPADLVAVGFSDNLWLWNKRASRAGIHSRIKFLGCRNDASNIIKAADCLISSSRYDSYGMAVHEAICSGIPALVSRRAGVSERYPEYLKELIIADPENTDDMVSHIKLWQANMTKYRAAMLPFSKELRKYTWDDMARDMINAIERS